MTGLRITAGANFILIAGPDLSPVHQCTSALQRILNFTRSLSPVIFAHVPGQWFPDSAAYLHIRLGSVE